MTRIEYVVTVRGPIPDDVGEHISSAHADALRRMNDQSDLDTGADSVPGTKGDNDDQVAK